MRHAWLLLVGCVAVGGMAAGCADMPQERRLSWAEVCEIEYGIAQGTAESRRCAIALDMQRRDMLMRMLVR